MLFSQKTQDMAARLAAFYRESITRAGSAASSSRRGSGQRVAQLRIACRRDARPVVYDRAEASKCLASSSSVLTETSFLDDFIGLIPNGVACTRRHCPGGSPVALRKRLARRDLFPKPHSAATFLRLSSDINKRLWARAMRARITY